MLLVVFRKLRPLLVILFVSLLTACATTGSGDPRDPWEGFNRSVYKFNETLDGVLFDPISKVYKVITPEIIDTGITNMFSNLGDISVIANDILQFKFSQAMSDLARFIFNSTLGLLGFFDVSTQMGFEKHNEDFGQTLATWGMGPGPFLMVPFFGPSTVRDATGFAVDAGLLNPVFYIEDELTRAGLLTLNYVDFKADLTSAVNLLEEAALDKYEFLKNAYFEKRENLINDGEIVLE
ncbi:MAG: VacJ family lipoprotein [Thiotrichales bacterium]|nr:VacJ family lipoprotein [Thiotrichales bacterium]